MTSQEKKKYLGQYKLAAQQVKRLQDKIIEWGERAEGLHSVVGGMPGGSGENSMQACLDKMVEYQNQLVISLKEEMELLNNIEQAIDTVQDERLRLLLNYRYVDGLKWDEVAEAMYYTRQHIDTLHGKALEKLLI